MQRYFPYALLFTVGLLGSALLFAGPSGGDLAKQQPKYHIKEIPPAPILTPEEELKTFKLPPGFHMELVAADPTVEEPIALTFDPDGRIYVVELRGYMPDMAGTGELDPVGRIVRLESSNHDGHYDQSTLFLDHLIIPRAVGLAGDGVLVAEPPNVWFCHDTKGDGVCDQKELIFNDYGTRQANPEHMANGLTFMPDNWYYNAAWNARFRFSKGKFLRDNSVARGQWGITCDDAGRLFYNSNSSMLHCDLVPAQYLTRNPYLGNPPGVGTAIAKNAVFPSRVTPGVNRGYTEDVNLDGKLQRVTAACSPVIYRGDRFPAEYQGNAFVCEPSGNLVCRQVITQNGLNLTAKSVQHDGVDFLTSTDERFRPVSLYNGPDGCLYLVDLYHGILQHKTYLSAYLADQVQKRDLDKNGGHRGRIWRIVSDAARPGPMPLLSKATTPDLVKGLSNPLGWWRDTCQRLIVERQDAAAITLLQTIVQTTGPAANPIAKLHALYALQSFDKLDDDFLTEVAKDADPRVRLAALRVGEVLIRKHTAPGLVEVMQTMATDPDPAVQLQVLMLASPDLPEIMPAGYRVLAAHLSEPIFRAAALNGALGRELDVLHVLFADKSFSPTARGAKELFSDLALCVVRSRSPQRIEQLLDFTGSLPDSAKPEQHALLSDVAEFLAPTGKNKTPPKHVRVLREPAGLARLLKSDDKKIADLARRTSSGLSWPNKPGDKTPPLKPLTAEEQKRFDAGRIAFTQICAQCHQSSGLGQEGIAPPLVDSEWALGAPERFARIALNGVRGPIKVGKRTVDLEMPGLYALSDDQIASVLTYIRREWGHEASPISPDLVAKVRKESASRGQAQWTQEELLQIK